MPRRTYEKTPKPEMPKPLKPLTRKEHPDLMVSRRLVEEIESRLTRPEFRAHFTGSEHWAILCAGQAGRDEILDILREFVKD